MYKKIKADQVPKRSRKGESRFEKTEEWRLMKADIDRGLKPQEALQVIFSPEDKKKYDINHRRTIDRFLKRYLKNKGLKYGVKTFHKDGSDYIVVYHTPPISRTA